MLKENAGIRPDAHTFGPHRCMELSDNSFMHVLLASKIPEITLLCERYGVSHLELFGSALGAEFDPESSDYDFLVELDARAAGSRVRRWLGLADALEALLGRHVDLVNPRSIRNPYFLQAVNKSRVLIYDRQDAQTVG